MPWRFICASCKRVILRLVPFLQTFSGIMDGAVKVVKIDTDKYPAIGSRFNVQVGFHA